MGHTGHSNTQHDLTTGAILLAESMTNQHRFNPSRRPRELRELSDLLSSSRTSPFPEIVTLNVGESRADVLFRRSGSHTKGNLMNDTSTQRLSFGADDLRLPDELRGPLREHLADLACRLTSAQKR